MTIFGSFPTKILEQQKMFRCRRQPFFAAEHMRDFHQMVINDIRQMISGKPIRFDKNLHVNLIIWDFNRTSEMIVYNACSVIRNFHTYNMRRACFKQPCDFLRRQRTTFTVVSRLYLTCFLTCPQSR